MFSHLVTGFRKSSLAGVECQLPEDSKDQTQKIKRKKIPFWESQTRDLYTTPSQHDQGLGLQNQIKKETRQPLLGPLPKQKTSPSCVSRDGEEWKFRFTDNPTTFQKWLLGED